MKPKINYNIDCTSVDRLHLLNGIFSTLSKICPTTRLSELHIKYQFSMMPWTSIHNRTDDTNRILQIASHNYSEGTIVEYICASIQLSSLFTTEVHSIQLMRTQLKQSRISTANQTPSLPISHSKISIHNSR